MKHLGSLLLGLCLSVGVIATLGCADDDVEVETPSGEVELEETDPVESDVEEAMEDDEK